jgi:PKD repeat protein
LVHEVDFSVSFSDTGTQDTHTAVWDWDDSTTTIGTVVETSGSGTVSGSHTFSAPGTYSVEVTVTDDDGGYDSYIIIVEVVDADEAIEDMNDYIQALDDSYFKNSPTNRKNAINNKISAILTVLENENYNAVINMLTEDIRDKADGQIDGLTGDDWITGYTTQYHICMKIDDIVEYLENFL